MPLRAQFKAASDALQQDFERRTAAFAQNLDKGEAREAALRSTLERWLPRRYSIGRGEIVDASGGHSNQIDVVVYDELNSPLLFREQDSPLMFPVESVYGFVEVKSNLDVKSLSDGWNKTISVYNLRRQEFLHSIGGVLSVSGNYKPFSALFAFDAPKDLDPLISMWGQTALAYPTEARLNMICILGRGCLMYVSADKVWSLGSDDRDIPTFVETRDDALMMFMLSAWTAMGQAPALTIPNPIAYAGGSLSYPVKMFTTPPPAEG